MENEPKLVTQEEVVDKEYEEALLKFNGKMNWYEFSKYLRYPFGALASAYFFYRNFSTTLISYKVYLVLNIILFILLTFFLAKYSKKFFIVFYLQILITILFFHLMKPLASSSIIFKTQISSDFGKSIIVGICEAIYFHKRRILFRNK